MRCIRSIGLVQSCQNNAILYIRYNAHIGHAEAPAIIPPNGLEYVTVVSSQKISKKFSPRLDIVILRDSDKIFQTIARGSKKQNHTISWQLPFGASPHLSLVICMRPCSPAPPTADGLQLLSCIAKDASKIEGTVCGD